MEEENNASDSNCSCTQKKVDHTTQTSFGDSTDHRPDQVVTDHRHHDDIKDPKIKSELVTFQVIYRRPIRCETSDRNAKKDQNSKETCKDIGQPNEGFTSAAAGPSAER